MEWISVKDRLPEEPVKETQEYLIANKDGDVRVAFYLRKDIALKNGVTDTRWYCTFFYAKKCYPLDAVARTA